MEIKNCLDPKGLAKYLGVNCNRAYELMRSRDFPSVKISERRWIVPLSSLDRWLAAQSEAGKGA